MRPVTYSGGVTSPSPLPVVVLISGTGSNLAALLRAAAVPGAPFEVVGVVAMADFPDRAAWDRALADAVAALAPRLVVLAGFMRLIGAPLLRAFPAAIINTHPALLPSFPGAHAVRDALAHGVKVTGASVIEVDEGVDTGRILAQRAVDVLDDDTEETLHERIKAVEREMLVDVVTRLADGAAASDAASLPADPAPSATPA